MNFSTQIRFSRSCPTCGRRVQIRASLMGSQIGCGHCHAKFVANAGEEDPGVVDDSQRLMDRVEQMLLRAELESEPEQTTAV